MKLQLCTKLFSPPYGDGTKIGDIEHEMSSFSSPYGDGTKILRGTSSGLWFSPPYGDGTDWKLYAGVENGFSPPYGDGTKETTMFKKDTKFSPPYGENPLSHGLRRASSPERGSLVQGKWRLRLRGFCGEKLKSGTKTLMAWQRSFCPLTGMVPTLVINSNGTPKFSPPYGDGTNFLSTHAGSVVFSPPYGDGT